MLVLDSERGREFVVQCHIMTGSGEVSPTILIAGIHFKAIPDYLHECLPSAIVHQADPKDNPGVLETADVLIPTMTRIDREMIGWGKKLRLIQQWGAGLEGVDRETATSLGIAVANVPTAGTGNAESVAEWAIMAAVVLSRGFPEIQQSVRRGTPWGTPCGWAMAGRTAGIIGIGGIGKVLARRLRAFDMRLIGVKRRPEGFPYRKYGFCWVKGMECLPELLGEADYIFLCLPLRPETRRLIGVLEYRCVRPGAFLINPSRGGLLDRSALEEALARDRLGGVALDVFWEEPTRYGDPLYSHPKVMATPHIAGVTDLSYRGIARRVARNIRLVMDGKIPHSCVNPECKAGSWWVEKP